ncbi:uncharacterized protein LOC117932461 isoform X1 [Vitis riparia]|uniref:uncharacterized protein LOC117932461 isoform X1 n=1 Tax=Vitis riparia TaxID=96939 RepID=UPI00155A1BB0|nr:uncharacterized protein LOC117932461 isoform X1 [Vitis riparia]XP_034709608.1 uncharacterized protein LOC117932461 isoform X1 [Vitis riparia]
MNVPNLTLPISHITINIVEMNWQEQRNFMFIQSSAFINNVQQPNFMPTYLTAILALVAFFVPALLDLIDLKFQKEANSVFEAHPITTMMAFATLLAFVLAFGIDFTFHSSHFSPICAALLRTAMMFSGSLLLASLASLLLPDALRPFLYVFYTFLSLANMHDLLRKCSLWIHLKIMDNLDTVLTAMRQWHMRRRVFVADSKQLGIRLSDDY